MQAEFQERRQWVSKPRFSGRARARRMSLPGATAVQLGIFLGYARGGWWGGLLAGLCFAAPGFVVMLALAVGVRRARREPVAARRAVRAGPGRARASSSSRVYRLGRTALRYAARTGCIALSAAPRPRLLAARSATVGILLLRRRRRPVPVPLKALGAASSRCS